MTTGNQKFIDPGQWTLRLFTAALLFSRVYVNTVDQDPSTPQAVRSGSFNIGSFVNFIVERYNNNQILKNIFFFMQGLF